MGQVVKHLKNKLVSSHYFTLLIAPVNALPVLQMLLLLNIQV